MCRMRQTARVAQVDYKDDGPQKFTVVVGPCESADRRFNFEKWGGPIASGVHAPEASCAVTRYRYLFLCCNMLCCMLHNAVLCCSMA